MALCLGQLPYWPKAARAAARVAGLGARVIHGLIDQDIAVANLDVEPAIRIRAYPCLVRDRRTLPAEVRQRHQITLAALAALRKA